jgi:hypothetical protein
MWCCRDDRFQCRDAFCKMLEGVILAMRLGVGSQQLLMYLHAVTGEVQPGPGSSPGLLKYHHDSVSRWRLGWAV